MRFQITTWVGETLFESEELEPAVMWFNLNSRRGDAIWDNDSGSHDPLYEVL